MQNLRRGGLKAPLLFVTCASSAQGKALAARLLMQLPKAILVGTDFSDTSDRALDYAIDLAKLLGAAVTVVHSYELPVYGFPDGALIATVEMATRLMTAAQAALSQTCETRAGKGVKLTPVLRQGIPWEEIHAVAEEVGADMIVIGTHGRKGLAHALLGSVAEKVVRTASRPVLTIHGPRGDGKKV